MSKILYIDCSISGISGDMTLAALYDLGVDIEEIEKKIQAFPIETFKIEKSQVVKKGISSKKIDVVIMEDVKKVNHRHYSHIKDMIEQSAITETAKEYAIKIFEHIAIAEAKIHNTTMEKVHFHEVGAVDSIVDIVGTAIALDVLGVEKVVSSPVVVGNGKISIDHGRYPVPAPATLELLTGIPIESTDVKGELTTPTGAGILRGMVSEFGPIPSMVAEKIGYGAGSKEFPTHPNVLRMILGTA
ncbi:nickel pincer cofactor biosynthesis protein LarC [Bacillus sp. Marseille-P3661]|uniref:nickel pincer cofactor biosynthesis protein LarC n=1 Tax=Bacillus sp. Marseille-P3661 TaxID=1936234 RepID=UPI000C845DAE|nr:nickel pincer cofactor biosynthesis protein LarC [Bacillus sp. Marseille-P3661]